MFSRRAHRLAVAVALLAAAPSVLAAQPSRWAKQAQRVTIHRDQWGIAHVYGPTDADAVFGMIYAQAEDDFNRVEMNYVDALGRMAEVQGERALWSDLRMRLFIDTLDLKAMYAKSPVWLKALMNSWADGLNYYLSTHPTVKPKLLTKFEPWMALAFSEGSIGGDISSVNLRGIEAFYAKQLPGGASGRSGGDLYEGANPYGWEPSGSNGIAIAPSNTTGKRAMLMINPHTSFYFRPEIHMVSDEGLNAYGAVTWGQFFIYQGFNERLGWMHTSGGGDVIDEYLEKVTPKGAGFAYQHGATQRDVIAKRITLRVKEANGAMGTRTITAYFTHHGPIIREQNGQWVAVAMMNKPLEAIQQSYGRTKARSLAEFKTQMAIRTNSSNNTVYADADGNIAYFHGNFVPKRDPKYDWTKPVDGSDPGTDWQGLHTLAEMIYIENPASGWLYNANNWPFTASGESSPKISDYPVYMSAQRENSARGIHAERVFGAKKDFTLDGMIAGAYDSYLPAFEQSVPPVITAWDMLPAHDSLKVKLAEPIAVLRAWDYRFGVQSVGMSLGHYYGEEFARGGRAARQGENAGVAYLAALSRAVDRLTRDFGTWKTPWGEINRYQRLSGEIGAPFDDSKPSIAVPFASANWGSLAAYSQSSARTTKRIYGDRGNSFVAGVEFGPRVRAKSVLAGGVHGDPSSPYFANQAERYAKGDFKDVNFYREDVEKHAVRTYHPGK